MPQSIPHKDNFCGGNFSDWLEVNLTPICNAKCAWCIEKKGWHPKEKASWQEIAKGVLDSGAKNILLLGGEPTLFPNIEELVNELSKTVNVYITTNGSMLDVDFVNRISKLKGINISVHHYNLEKNKEITKIGLNHSRLFDAIAELKDNLVSVRFNCNCIKGYIDSEKEIYNYIEFAKLMDADGVRFAELKDNNGDFVNLYEILNGQYGLNNDPFFHGCNKNTTIDNMPVNFRLMCGLQTDQRVAPPNPVQHSKKVLYYDGKIYNGWQRKEKKMNIQEAALRDVLKLVQENKMTIDSAVKIILALESPLSKKKSVDKREIVYVDSGNGNSSSGGGCQY